MRKKSKKSLEILAQVDEFLSRYHDGYAETYQFTLKEIAALANVDIRTARRWVQRRQEVGPHSNELLRLHVTGRVLPINWQKCGHRFVGDDLLLNFGAYRLTCQQINTYWLMLQEVPQQAAEIRQLREYIDYLESLLPRAQVVELRGQRPSATVGAGANPLFNKSREVIK